MTVFHQKQQVLLPVYCYTRPVESKPINLTRRRTGTGLSLSSPERISGGNKGPTYSTVQPMLCVTISRALYFGHLHYFFPERGKTRRSGQERHKTWHKQGIDKSYDHPKSFQSACCKSIQRNLRRPKKMLMLYFQKKKKCLTPWQVPVLYAIGGWWEGGGGWTCPWANYKSLTNPARLIKLPSRAKIWSINLKGLLKRLRAWTENHKNSPQGILCWEIEIRSLAHVVDWAPTFQRELPQSHYTGGTLAWLMGVSEHTRAAQCFYRQKITHKTQNGSGSSVW